MMDIKFNNSIEIPKVKKFNKPNIKHKKQKKLKTLDLIKNDISAVLKYAGGKYIKFDDKLHTEGLLIGGVLEKNDKLNNKEAKFAVLNKDKDLIFIDSFEHFTLLKDIPSSLYVLSYLYKTDPVYLYSLTENEIEINDNVELFTEIYLTKNRKQNKRK